MAEPVRKPSARERSTPVHEDPDQEHPGDVVHRWVKGPDGRMELLELPLTPERFLNPRIGDQILQGVRHEQTVTSLIERVRRHLRHDRDVLVISDTKHLLGGGLPGPGPDLSVIRGLRRPESIDRSFDLRKERVPPCLIIEVVSGHNAELRRTDEVDKVALYERIGVREYLLMDLPRPATENRFRVRGLRLGPDGRYRPIEPDARGRVLSETTGLLFAVAPDGDGIDVFDAATGERVRTPVEEEDGRKAAEQELSRLRAEIETLKSGG